MFDIIQLERENRQQSSPSIENRSGAESSYGEAISEDRTAGFGESHEELLLGQRIGGELPMGERKQVTR
jgi:hypothetical protein